MFVLFQLNHAVFHSHVLMQTWHRNLRSSKIEQLIDNDCFIFNGSYIDFDDSDSEGEFVNIDASEDNLSKNKEKICTVHTGRLGNKKNG